jgi:hypothetical protein
MAKTSLRQRKFLSFFRDKIKDIKGYDSPMALYEWLLREWGRPLNLDGMRQAYLAAWAFSIDRGLVKL